ncbi:MAG: LysM peptidoglycan-binding domain-containing protein [Flavobacteriales bacterium]
MTYQALRYCSMLALALHFCAGLTWTLAQTTPENWAQEFDRRIQLADYTLFYNTLSSKTIDSRMPPILSAIPPLDELEESLQPWGEDKHLEARCMQILLNQNGKRLKQMGILYSMYSSDIGNSMDQSSLPPAFQWLPMLLTHCNHRHATTDGKNGLWSMDRTIAKNSGLTMNDRIDERFIPSSSSVAAINHLQQLQRKFPDDPIRVLVAFSKGVEFAMTWDALPGSDDDLDAWLGLYRVVSRMMVNVEVPNTQIEWIAFSNSMSPVPCDVSLSKNELVQSLGLTETTIEQFIPWWIGSKTMSCDDFNEYTPRLPISTNTPTSPGKNQESKPCIFHEVKKGDTLWNLSQRYPGTTPDMIKEINDIKDHIRIGDVLCIPKSR